MNKRATLYLLGGLLVLAAAVTIGCGSNAGPNTNPQSVPATPSGQVVAFGADAPVCDVESFIVQITNASLVPQNGRTPVTLISSTTPATVDFARLADFTNILNSASVAPGTYSQLQLTLANPQLVVLNTSATPPAPVTVNPTTLTSTSPITININPVLVVSSSTTSGLMVDFDLRRSVQVDGNGQVTGMVDPQFTIAATTTSGTTVGEATSLYGIIQSPTTSGVPSGFAGSFGLTVADGVGQTLTVLSNSDTVFEGDGVTTFAELTANTFVEVDAIVNTSGQIIAQTVDSEEQTSSAGQKSAFLGKVIGVTRDGSGNATAFTLLVDDEIPNMNGAVPLRSGLNVTLTDTTHYWTNWQHWNRQVFTFSPQTLGVAERVAVFGVLAAGTPPTLTADRMFLRPRTVTGNFNALLAAGSDGKTGGFTMTPCGALFGGQPITVLTYADTFFTGVSGLPNLTPSPTLRTYGDLFYEQANGTTKSGASWTAPTWVIQARGVHQLPN